MTRSRYFAPILAYGKTDAKLTTAAILAGAVSIPLDNSGDEYALGDNLFISENDDSEVQFLGKIESINGAKTAVTVDIPVFTSKASSARVWMPTTSYELHLGPGTGLGRRQIPGVHTRISRGSVVFTTRTAGNAKILLWRFSRENFGRSFDWQGVMDWLADNRRDGLDSFSLAYWDPYSQEGGAPACDEVRAFDKLAGSIDDAGYQSMLVRVDESTADLDAAEHLLRFIIIDDDKYVGA